MRTNDITCTINMLLDTIYSHFRYSAYRLMSGILTDYSFFFYSFASKKIKLQYL